MAVPFTCPMLSGARVRLMEKRCDLVVPHPGGARGVYILALASLGEYCVPTLHDMRLAAALAALPSLTPAGIRAAARGVAIEGAAGRAAAAAAAASVAADSARATAIESRLLSALTLDAEASPGGNGGRTRHALHRLAGRTGRTPEAVLADIAMLAGHLVDAGLDLPVGPNSTLPPGRCRSLLAALAAMAGQINDAGLAHRAGAVQLKAAATAMQAAGRVVLEAAEQKLQRPDTLLDDWSASPQDFATKIARADWLLDGWDAICLLWRLDYEDGASDLAVAEAVRLLPPIPAEADGWLAALPGLQASLHACCTAIPTPRARMVLPGQGLGQVERNERIRAATL